jgi:CBS domain-containing protein
MANDITVSDLMSTALLTATPSETIERADLDMKLAEIHHVPVVDERNHLVGIVSDRDILRAFGSSDTQRIKIADVMSSDVKTAGPDDPASAAAETMLDEKISCLPVIGEDGQLVGMITNTDFLDVARKALAGDDDFSR